MDRSTVHVRLWHVSDKDVDWGPHLLESLDLRA